MAAAVLFDLERLRPADVRALTGLNDSKQQSHASRAALYPIIMRVAVRVAIVSRCAPGIDRRGLHVTNLQALADALRRVARPGCLCLSDGFPVAPLGFEQRPVIGGDAKSAAIAAASVLAKETRDRYMRRVDRVHPGWQFAQHVGYATPEHRQAIERQGISPLHRLSFQSAAYQQLALLGGELSPPPTADADRDQDAAAATLHVLGRRPILPATSHSEGRLEMLEARQPA